MNKSLVIVAGLVFLLTIASASPRFLEQQAEESSQDVGVNSFDTFGMVADVCFCIRGESSESSEASESSESSQEIDCYCRRGNETMSEESSAESSEGSEGSNLAITPNAVLDNQVILACTCLYKTRPFIPVASNYSFLLPHYSGFEKVPIDCTCKDIESRNTSDLFENKDLAQKFEIPIANGTFNLAIGNGSFALGTDKVPISVLNDVSKLLPLWCNASLPFPFFKGRVLNYDPMIPHLFARCLPKLTSNDTSASFRTTTGNWTVNVTQYEFTKWNLTIPAINLTSLYGDDGNSDVVNVEGLNVTVPLVSFKLLNLTERIDAPPFVLVGPNILDYYELSTSIEMQTVAVRRSRRNRRILF